MKVGLEEGYSASNLLFLFKVSAMTNQRRIYYTADRRATKRICVVNFYSHTLNFARWTKKEKREAACSVQEVIAVASSLSYLVCWLSIIRRKI